VAEKRAEAKAKPKAADAAEPFKVSTILDSYVASLSDTPTTGQTRSRLAKFKAQPFADGVTWGEVDARELDAELMDQWHRDMIAGHYGRGWRSKAGKELPGFSAAHTNKTGSAIRQALQHATKIKSRLGNLNHGHRVLDENPLADWRPRQARELPTARYLSTDEQTRLREALRARDAEVREKRERLIEHYRERGYRNAPESFGNAHYVDHVEPLVLLILNTGLRTDEAFTLEWDRVNLADRILRIEEGKSAAAKREIPLNREALAVVEGWKGCPGDHGVRPGEHFVFESVDRLGRPVPLGSIKNAWAALMERAEIDTATPYVLRATFASNLFRRGATVKQISRLLGHADTATTERAYGFLSDGDAGQAVHLLDEEAA
jgi:integrase